MLDVRDGLRLPSTKNIPIELRTTKKLLGDGADGFQALEPLVGQPGRPPAPVDDDALL